MAIHHTDKNSPARTAPYPNIHDTQDVTRMAHGTNSVNYITDASPTFNGPSILYGNARLVQSGTVTVVTPNGTSGTITTTTTTLAHNLGYTPLATAFMNNIQPVGYGITLPIWVSFGNNTGGSGGAPEYLGIIRYMTYAVDATNFYVLTYSSGVAVAANYTITFYLYQQIAQ